MDEKRFTLRMDGELFQEISTIASEHRRSTAKEIECAIARYIVDIKRREIMSGEKDVDNLSQEDAQAKIKAYLALSDRFKKFIPEE